MLFEPDDRNETVKTGIFCYVFGTPASVPFPAFIPENVRLRLLKV
jgi:hypothetical protein